MIVEEAIVAVPAGCVVRCTTSAVAKMPADCALPAVACTNEVGNVQNPPGCCSTMPVAAFPDGCTETGCTTVGVAAGDKCKNLRTTAPGALTTACPASLSLAAHNGTRIAV